MKHSNTIIAAIAALTCTAAIAGCSTTITDNVTPTSTTSNNNATTTPAPVKTTPLPTATFNKPVTAKMKAVNISIPSIKLDEPIQVLGLNKNGNLEPPKGVVQQFNGFKRVTPGMNGIALIAGHVTYNGPDVFYNLEKIKTGDEVTISYDDKNTRKFKVVRSQSINKEALQTDPQVWGESKTPSLVIATCDATSKLIGKHHVNNYIVWAVPENS